MPKKKGAEDYIKSLSESFYRWEWLYCHGGQDPFYADGVNLNLVRNHIIYYKRQIAETIPPGQYPEIYYRDLPPEVDPDYMARPEEILANAKSSLTSYLSDPNYRYLCSRVNSLSPQNAKKVSIRNVIYYAAALGEAIRKGDLVTMRRHEKSEYCLDTFASCVKRLDDLSYENEQMSLFDCGDNWEDIEDEDMEF